MEKEQVVSEVVIEVAKEVGKEVYTDVAHPVAKNVGNFFGTLSGFFSNVVMYPLKRLNIEYEQKAIAFERKMKEKYDNIPIDNRVEPELHVVGPTLESLKYRILDEELSELFSNLLISNLDANTQKSCSPAFIKIIEQLSSTDAKVYKRLSELFNSKQNLAVCKVVLKSKNNPKTIVKKEFLPQNILNVELFDIDPFELSKSIEALKRLGLISISFIEWLQDESEYVNLVNQKYLIDIKEFINNFQSEQFQPYIDHKGVLTFTEFSYAFAEVCLRKK